MERPVAMRGGLFEWRGSAGAVSEERATHPGVSVDCEMRSHEQEPRKLSTEA
jgi:hypothetical protein